MALAQRLNSATAGHSPAPGAAAAGSALSSMRPGVCRCSSRQSSILEPVSSQWAAAPAVGMRHAGPVRQTRGQRSLHVACAAAASSSSSSAPELPSGSRRPDPVYMEEYKQLKERILTTARKAGAVLAAYLLFTVDGEAGLCALIGMAANNLYLTLLFRDVDAFTGETQVAMRSAEQIQQPGVRLVAKVAAAYQHALQPRLLVLVALAGATAAWNQLNPESALDLSHQGCLLGGFLMYKVPLVIMVADDNIPKSYGDNEMSRPTIEKFDDDLDRWGRPRKPLITMPTEVLPDNIDAEQAQSQMEALSSGVAKLTASGDNTTTSSSSGTGAPGGAPAAQPPQAQRQQQS